MRHPWPWLITLPLLFAVPGCALVAPTAPAGRFVEVASGRTLSADEFYARALAADKLLLGERHDNPDHHALRGQLIARLALARPGLVVVAEQLEIRPIGAGAAEAAIGIQSPAEPAPLREVAWGNDLLASLTAAGFDAQGWDWPMHQPLFAPLAAGKIHLRPGNLPREQVRLAARGGVSSLPPALAAVVEAAPLTEAGQAALDADLIAGHCGQLPEARRPAMRAAQRARDAAMFSALRDSGGRPAVLVAGNGHVRTDYGVPVLIARQRPAPLLISLGMLEVSELEAGADLRAQPYTYVWIGRDIARDDPCAGFKPM